MRKGADFTIAQQPGNFRDAHVAFYQVSAGKIGSQFFQQLGERKSFRGKASRKRSLAQSKLPCNVTCCCLSVRKQGRDRIFNSGLERAPLSFPMSRASSQYESQQVIEIRISADDAGVPGAHWEHNVVDRGAELDIVAKDFRQSPPWLSCGGPGEYAQGRHEIRSADDRCVSGR